jgi:hypothetical protein
MALQWAAAENISTSWDGAPKNIRSRLAYSGCLALACREGRGRRSDIAIPPGCPPVLQEKSTRDQLCRVSESSAPRAEGFTRIMRICQHGCRFRNNRRPS